MNKILSKMIRHRLFFPLWKKMNELAMYGMNFGVASGYADYSGELYIMRKVKEIFGNDICIFDIGANIGDWSKFLIQEYQNCSYNLYMFEPSHHAFEQLQKNIPSAFYHHFFRIGFGDQQGEQILYSDAPAQGSASLLMSSAKYAEKIYIDTIDRFCKEHSIEQIDFLKMDVQGYEYNILQGAQSMLKEGKIGVIQFEFDAPNIDNRIFFKDFWELLTPDYDLYHSLYNGLVKIEAYHYTLENFRCMNYVAIHKRIRKD